MTSPRASRGWRFHHLNQLGFPMEHSIRRVVDERGGSAPLSVPAPEPDPSAALLDAYSRVTVGVSEKVCPSVVSVEVLRLSGQRGGRGVLDPAMEASVRSPFFSSDAESPQDRIPAATRRLSLRDGAHRAPRERRAERAHLHPHHQPQHRLRATATRDDAETDGSSTTASHSAQEGRPTPGSCPQSASFALLLRE